MDRQSRARGEGMDRPQAMGSAAFDPAGAAAGVIDLGQIAQLRELGGEDEPELVLDLIELFLSDAHQRLAEMRLALMTQDHRTIARTAHTLKSSAGSMGAVLLSQVCKEIEELARNCAGSELNSRAESCFEAYEKTEQALKLLDE